MKDADASRSGELAESALLNLVNEVAQTANALNADLHEAGRHSYRDRLWAALARWREASGIPGDSYPLSSLPGAAAGEVTEEPVERDFERELQTLINQHSAENGSNTPDFILAQFMLGCLGAWNVATQQRENWYGRDPRPSCLNPSALSAPPSDTTQTEPVARASVLRLTSVPADVEDMLEDLAVSLGYAHQHAEGLTKKGAADEHARVLAIIERLRRAPSPSGTEAWRPISEAPKDGTAILISDGNGSEVAWWGPDETEDPHWWTYMNYPSDMEPTHWQPVPLPPEGK